MEAKENATLAFSDIAQGGTSDKVYIINLDRASDGWSVVAQYGRRGGALATDNKTKNGPVDYEAAKKIFDKVVREKIAKGYVRQAGEGARAPVTVSDADYIKVATSYGAAPSAEDEDSIRSQELLTEIGRHEAMDLIEDSDYWMQDKSDGHSRGVVKIGGVIFGLNKLGKRVPLPAELHEELSQIKLRTFHIDAELVGQKLVARDILNADGDLHELPYEQRFERLVKAIYRDLHRDFKFISVVKTWDGARNKGMAFEQQMEERREGVVFKLRSAPHRAGRNGQHKKFKFIKTLSAITGKPRATGKDSVEIFLIDGAKLVSVGSVSLIGKGNIEEGVVVEVAYLYASAGKRLIQPRLLRKRLDVTKGEATTAQLIFKREEE